MMRRTRARLRIQLLGGFKVTTDDRVVLDQGWSRRKAMALLKLVALQPSGQILRDQLCESLWPELDPRAATNNLHKNLHYLREALSEHVDGGLLSLQGDMVRLGEDVEVDLRECLALAAEARQSKDPGAYERALACMDGDVLPEDAYEEWAAGTRESLAATKAELLRELAGLHIASANWDRAIARIQELLNMEPTDEDAHRTLMQLYFETGSRHKALRQFEICREMLESELGVEPSPATLSLYKKLLADEAAPAMTASTPVAVQAPPADRVAPPPVSYGREGELAILEEAIREAGEGCGSFLLFVGEAGSGKSHLLRHAAAHALEAGAVALHGRAYEFDAQAPYQPLRDVLRDLLRSELAAVAEPLLRRSIYVRRLLPDARPDAPQTESADLQAELFEEMWRLFATLAQQRPLVLLLDDLDAAEEDTLRLVHFIGRRAPEARIMLAGSVLADAGGSREPINNFRTALRKDRVAREIAVRPLGPEALRAVVESVFSGGEVEEDLIEEILERSQGNPLLARELAASLIEEGWARLEAGRWRRHAGGQAAVPLAAYDMLQHRIEHLSNGSRHLLNAAAVSPVGSSFAVLRDVSSLDAAAALDALDECIEAGLLEEAESGYRFRHELVREAACGALTRARRQQLHRATAEALLSSPGGADPGIVSYHLAESDEPWRSVPYMLETAQRAESVFAHEQAKEALERALDLARQHASFVEAALAGKVTEALGDLERRLGHVAASVPLFEDAVGCYSRAEDPESAARARGKAALGHIVLGNADEAERLIEATLHALTDSSPQHVVSRTYYLLAQLHWHSGENRDALEAAKQALLAAEEVADPLHRAKAYEVLALACHSLGDWQQGVEYELSRQALGISGFDTDEAFDAHL